MLWFMMGLYENWTLHLNGPLTGNVFTACEAFMEQIHWIPFGNSRIWKHSMEETD